MLKEKETVSLIIDSTTGNVINEIALGDQIRIIRAESILAYQGKVVFDKKEPFVKMFSSTTKALSKINLTAAEYKIIFSMIEYIDYESGALKWQGGHNGKLICTADIQEIASLSKQTTTNSLQKLVEREIYARFKVGRENNFVVNPFIFMRGSQINETLFDIFKATQWAKLHYKYEKTIKTQQDRANAIEKIKTLKK